MAPHPVCGFSLQIGTTVVAALQIIGAIFVLVQGIFLIISGGGGGLDNAIGALIFFIIVIIYLILGIILLKGSQERKMWKCRTWLICQSVFVVLAILGLLKAVVTLTVEIEVIISVILNLYFIWIVWAFIEELKVKSTGGSVMGGGANSANSVISKV